MARPKKAHWGNGTAAAPRGACLGKWGFVVLGMNARVVVVWGTQLAKPSRGMTRGKSN